MAFRFGIDLGGTKIELVAIDESGALQLRRRTPTPSGDYNGTVKAIRTLVQDAEQTLGSESAGPCPIGIGIPGTLSTVTGLVKNANSTCLIGQPLKEDLEHALTRPVRLANDADCFALSEATDGSGAHAGIVFGVILGTGVGGGLVIDGRIVRGPNAITGEWGHNPLPWPDASLDEIPGPLCYCGQKGCVETFLSGPGLIADVKRYSSSHTWKTVEDVATAADQGDSDAQACMERYCNRLAKGLASIINVIDPDVIVLGGGLSNITMIYDRVPDLWETYVFSDSVATRLVQNKHGDSSGVRGAAWLWPAET